MLQIIIFSFNRAMQLDALLDSIEKCISKDLCERVTVIYNTSSVEYEKGYAILKERYDCQFLKELQVSYKLYPLPCYLRPFNWRKLIRNPKARRQKTNFRELTLQCLSDSDAELTMFLTDDSIFIQPVNLRKEWMEVVNSNAKSTQLSLRLGNGYDIMPTKRNEENDLVSWHYSDNRVNTSWGYRFSVDAHLYQTKQLESILRKCVFTNPTFLEGFVQDYATRHNLWNNGYSLKKPCILSYPLNMVQTIDRNESQNVSPQMMNDLYLKGYKIVYPIPSVLTAFQQYPEYVEFENTESNQRERISLSAPTY